MKTGGRRRQQAGDRNVLIVQSSKVKIITAQLYCYHYNVLMTMVGLCPDNIGSLQPSTITEISQSVLCSPLSKSEFISIYLGLLIISLEDLLHHGSS